MRTVARDCILIQSTPPEVQRRASEGLEERVKARTAELERALDELNAYSYTVAHDLRTPLRTMTRFADVLLADHAAALDGEGQDFLRRIGASATRMDKLIRDLLAYGKVARAEARIVPLSVESVLDQVLAQISEEVPRTRARVEVERPLPVAQADPLLLSQALDNLILNALKFVPPGGRRWWRCGPSVVTEPGASGSKIRGSGLIPDSETASSECSSVFKVRKSTRVPALVWRSSNARSNEWKGQVGYEPRPAGGTRFWVDLPSGEANAATGR